MRETIRAWIEAMEAPFLEIIFEKRRGKRAALVRSALFGLSKLYQLYLVIHRFAIRSRLIRDSTLGIQVIAIGNLTLGGTGKTPVVEKFARELQKQGRTVAILSRGWRSKPQPFAPDAFEQTAPARGQHSAPPGLGREIPPARFRDGRGRTLHARFQSQGRRGAGGQKPRQERPLRHREFRLRHPSARRRLPVPGNWPDAGRTSS